MSKLQVKPQAGYTRSQSSTNPAMYPNTTVESIYWEKEHMTLEEALRNGGGGSGDVQTEMPEDGFAPNTFYNLGTITENTAFLMAEGEEGKANHYFWVFETGDDVPEITWPEDIRMWEDNKAPVIAANHHYEISVYDGVGLYEVIGIEAPNPMIYQPLTFDVEYKGSGELRFFYRAYIGYESIEHYDEILENRLQSIEASTDGGNTWFEVEPVTYPFDDTTKSVLLNDGDTIMFRGDHPMQVSFFQSTASQQEL